MSETLAAFMGRANAAYYATRDPFRDFTTAPEISQVFGEVLGAWVAVVWQAMGAPNPFVLAEAGPGRGTLMADARRLLARTAPDCHRAARLHLIETSPRLRAIQAERLADASWHEQVGTVPAGPMVMLANEFLDALPVRQFVRVADALVERRLEGGRLVPEGAVIERGEAAGDFVGAVARRVRGQGGAALFIDYGPAAGGADSLQAIRDGRPADPLADPGRADLTAHVDFAMMAAAARAGGAAVHGPVPQGAFLTRLGLFARTERLARAQPDRAAEWLDSARRLADPARMGTLFKVLAVIAPGLPVPPGFDA